MRERRVGRLDLQRATEFTIGLAFGTTQHDALSTLAQSLSIPFEETRKSFVRQWERTSKRFALGAISADSKLFERSVNLLLAHEDKTYPVWATSDVPDHGCAICRQQVGTPDVMRSQHHGR